MNIPDRLYKFRSFSGLTLDSIVNNNAYYASPKELNDPFECDVGIDFDQPNDIDKFEKAWKKIEYEKYDSRNMTDDRAYRLKANIDNNIDLQIRDKGDYQSSKRFRRHKTELYDAIMDKLSKYGVLSLSDNWNSTLMWSHYADGHRGLCIEYDTKGCRCKSLKKIRYIDLDSNHVRNRLDFDKLLDWILSDYTTHNDLIKESIFFAKSSHWIYESEWRDIDEHGCLTSPFRLTSGIYFGLRCPHSVIMSIIKLLYNPINTPTFYMTILSDNPYEIDRYEIKPCEYIESAESSATFRHEFLFPPQK